MAEKNVDKGKRKFKRTNIEIGVKYQPVQFQSWYDTVTEGIGTDGVCLMSREYLGIGTIINLQLPLSTLKRAIHVTGKVIWSDFLIDKKLYESGIEFVKLSKVEKELISSQIDDFISHRSNIPRR
jgi:hypothetical protein